MERQSRVVHSGNQYAASFAARCLNETCARNEAWKGIEQVRDFERLPKEFSEDPDGVEGRLEALQSLLLHRNRFTLAVVGSPAAQERVRS